MRDVLTRIKQTNKRLFFILTGVLVVASQLLSIQPAGAAITQRGTVTSANSSTNNVTSIAVNKPTGVVAGDVMVATITVSGVPALTVPTGWNLVEASVTTNTTLEMGVWTRVAGASEGANYTWSWTGTQRAAGTIVAYTGVDNSTVVDNSGAAHSKNTGTSAAPSTATFTTTSANTVLVASFADTTNASNFAVASAATAGAFDSELTETASNSVTTPNVDTSVDVKAWSGSGATGAVSTTSTNTAWIAQAFALKPAGAPTFDQTGYRFSVNADNTFPHYMKDNLTGVDDTIRGVTNDTINGYMYEVGDNGANWVIEKRRIADGALCTSTNCGTTFGTAGRVTEDVAASATEIAYSVAVDPSLNSIFVVGMDNVTGGGEWRIEKRDALTGNLDTTFNSTGIVQSNPSSQIDEALQVLLDNINGYLYVGGYDGTGNNQWRLEKYKASTGLICTAINCGTLFGTGGAYSNNISNSDDKISNLAIDPTNSYLFVSGYSTANNGKTQWTMIKMRTSDAALCTAANCGTQFASSGTFTEDPTNGDDKILALQVDSAANAIYIGGSEEYSNGKFQWRIDKLSVDAGALVTAFGGSGCNSNEAGALCTVFSSGTDKLYDLALDGAGGYIYVFGTADETASNSTWRVQKRQRSDGSLVSAFGTSGTTSVDPSTGKDTIALMALDTTRGLMWVAGNDRSLGTTNAEWYMEQLQLDTGTKWLAAANTVGGLSSGVTFRLRLLLHVTTGNNYITDTNSFKLQYAVKSGTCDTAFVGETYADLATAGTADLLWQDNPSNANPVNMVAISGEDPTHSTDTVVPQSLYESNNFTNGVADVLNGQDGMWDFAIKDNGAFGAYCFRAVTSAGATLANYSIIPEVTFCKDNPKTESLLRHGQYFCEGVKKKFFWSGDTNT